MNNFDLLSSKLNKIVSSGIYTCTNYSFGSAGFILEELLCISKNSLPIADFCGIEIKSLHNKRRYKKLKLFCATPDSHFFVSKQLLDKYGYYTNGSKKFYINVFANKYSKSKNNYYFKLSIDHFSKNVFLNIYDKDMNLLSNDIFWSFDYLNEIVTRKIDYLAIVYYDKYINSNKLFISYTGYDYYNLKNFGFFLNAIHNGMISISFLIGTKAKNNYIKIYDHGTSFNINSRMLQYVYNKIEKKNT